MYFCWYTPFFKIVQGVGTETMKFQIAKIDLFLRNIISSHLKGLIEPLASERNAHSGSM